MRNRLLLLLLIILLAACSTGTPESSSIDPAVVRPSDVIAAGDEAAVPPLPDSSIDAPQPSSPSDNPQQPIHPRRQGCWFSVRSCSWLGWCWSFSSRRSTPSSNSSS